MTDYTMDQFVTDAQRTKAAHSSLTVAGPRTVDILHAVIGVATEGGELLDAVKKMLFYGKPLDMVNLDEEMGDVLWYIAIYCKARDTSFEALSQRITAKLRARYPDKFTQEAALNRNLAAEREILENRG